MKILKIVWTLLTTVAGVITVQVLFKLGVDFYLKVNNLEHNELLAFSLLLAMGLIMLINCILIPVLIVNNDKLKRFEQSVYKTLEPYKYGEHAMDTDNTIDDSTDNSNHQDSSVGR